MLPLCYEGPPALPSRPRFRVYKALVGVKKNATTQSVEVTSSVYLVKGVTAHEGVPVLWQVPGHRAALPGETKEEPAKLIEWSVYAACRSPTAALPPVVPNSPQAGRSSRQGSSQTRGISASCAWILCGMS